MNKKFYNSYIDLFESLSDKTQSIFRGQSNTGNFWEITSSYNRKYNKSFHKQAFLLKKDFEKYNDIKEYESFCLTHLDQHGQTDKLTDKILSFRVIICIFGQNIIYYRKV